MSLNFVLPTLLQSKMLYAIRQLTRDFGIFNNPKFTEEDYPDLSGKVFIVTGASSGIGSYVAKLLCAKHAKVYMYGRTESRLNQAIELVKSECPDALVEGVLVDYNDLATLRPAVDKFLNSETRLDGIVHNAGMNFAKPGATSAQGLDMTLAVNCVAGWLFQKYLDDIMEKTAEQSAPNSVRIVWVSSSAHFLSPSNGGIHWDDMTNPPNGLLKFGKYGQSKAIVMYESILWPLHHENSKVVSVCVHPGLIKSEIMRDFNSFQQKVVQSFCHQTKFGAYTELYPLLSPDVTTADNGWYYVPFDHKTHARKDVWDAAHGEGGQRLYAWLDDQISGFV